MNKKQILLLAVFICTAVSIILHFHFFPRETHNTSSYQENNIFSSPSTTDSNEQSIQKEVTTGTIKEVAKEPNSNVMISQDISNRDMQKMLDEITFQNPLLLPPDLQNLMNIEIIPMYNPPEDVQLIFAPETERDYTSKRYVSACDEDGEIIADPDRGRMIANIGKQKAYVTVVDKDKGLITVRYEDTALFMLSWIGDKEYPELIKRNTNSQYSEYTYTSDGTPIRAVINGQLFDSATSKKKRPIPVLTLPSDKVKPGSKWRCEAPGNKKSYIDAEAKRFVEIEGIPCLELGCKTYLTDGVSIAESLEKVYIDIKTGMKVRVDSVNKYIVPDPDRNGETIERHMRIISQLEIPD